MQFEQAAALIKALGSDPMIDEDEGWVRASCVLAPFTHKSGSDSNPSFGIKLEPGERPFFHCFSCLSGGLEDLIGSIELYLTQRPDMAYRFDLKAARMILDNIDIDIIPLPEFSEFGQGHKQEFEEWPQWYIDSFVQWQHSKEAFTYLKSRGVTAEQAKRFDIRFDSKKHMVVFPYWSVYGKLSGARGRSVVGGKGYTGHFDYTWNERNNARMVWYNEQVLNTGDPVVVVEGQFDVLAVDRVYPCVLGNLTAKPTPEKMAKLAQAPWVILFNDSDEAGQVANQKYLSYLIPQGVKTTTIDYPKIVGADGELEKLDPDKMGSIWIASKLAELGLM